MIRCQQGRRGKSVQDSEWLDQLCYCMAWRRKAVALTERPEAELEVARVEKAEIFIHWE